VCHGFDALTKARHPAQKARYAPGCVTSEAECPVPTGYATHRYNALSIGAHWLTLALLIAAGKPISFFGFELPALIGADEASARSLEDIHETIGVIGYYLIGLHASAALFHHYFMRDDALLRMLPWR
jgi:cytochrome b561